MNRNFTNQIQGTVNTALKAILRLATINKSISLWTKTHTPLMCVLAARRHSQAYQKCHNLNSAMVDILKEPMYSAH